MIELAPTIPIQTTFDMAELYVMTCYYNNKSDWRFPHHYETREHYIKGWNSSDYAYRFNDISRDGHLWKVTPVRTK